MTLDEIDKMRSAVRGTFPSSMFGPSTTDEAVEMRLQTYIANGVTLDELKARAAEIHKHNMVMLDAWNEQLQKQLANRLNDAPRSPTPHTAAQSQPRHWFVRWLSRLRRS